MAEAPQFNPQEAKTFLADFVDVKAFDGKPDTEIKGAYDKIHGAVTKHAPNMVPFGAKWREHIAGDNQEAMQTLGRFQDPKALWASYNELRAKMASGELKQSKPFPKDGPAEAQAQWRKDNGVPESPDKYDIKLDGNVVIGENDKPMVDGFLKYAHGLNWSNDQAKGALQWYFGTYLPEGQQAQHAEDSTFRQEAQATLAQKWGQDYKRNLEATKNFAQRAPEALRHRLLGGRLADGRPIGDDPEMLQWFAAMELELNPHTALIGPGGGDQITTIDSRLDEIRKVMRTDRAAYNKDTKMQDEYRQLLDAKARLEERGKAKA